MLIFENYVKKLKDDFNFKIEIIDFYVEFMEQYGYSYLMLFFEGYGYNIEIIHRYQDTYKLEYSGGKGSLAIFDTEIDINVFKVLKDEIKHINIQDVIKGSYDFNELRSILQHTDEKLDLSFILASYESSNDNTKILNDLSFQNLLLSKQSENSEQFFQLFDEYDDAILDPSIKEKYSDLYQSYIKKKKSQKFNL
jgi:hypothetical protein